MSVVQLTGVSVKEENQFFVRCKAVNISVIRGQIALHPKTTHLVVGALRRTEKLLSAIAAGIRIVPKEFLEASIRESRLLVGEEQNFAIQSSEFYIAPTAYRRGQKAKGGFFYDWKVVVLANDIQLRDQYVRILRHGGAIVNIWPVKHLVDMKKENLDASLTHILAEPNVLTETGSLSPLLKVAEKDTKVHIVSFTFVEEYLTSKAHPDPRVFDVFKENVMSVHEETKRKTDDEMIHDRKCFGSPHISIDPSLLMERLHLDRLSDRPRRRSGNAPPRSNELPQLNASPNSPYSPGEEFEDDDSSYRDIINCVNIPEPQPITFPTAVSAITPRSATRTQRPVPVPDQPVLVDIVDQEEKEEKTTIHLLRAQARLFMAKDLTEGRERDQEREERRKQREEKERINRANDSIKEIYQKLRDHQKEKEKAEREARSRSEETSKSSDISLDSWSLSDFGDRRQRRTSIVLDDDEPITKRPFLDSEEQIVSKMKDVVMDNFRKESQIPVVTLEDSSSDEEVVDAGEIILD